MDTKFYVHTKMLMGESRDSKMSLNEDVHIFYEDATHK